MAQTTYQRALKAIEDLSEEELRRLIGVLAKRLSTAHTQQDAAPPLTDFFGVAPNPKRQVDAQEWVSHSRQKSEERLKE